MNISHLNYFSKVYELKNYSQAAESLYLSRQALRQAIKTIERELECSLFSNRGNCIQPTKAADYLYAASQKTLISYSELKANLAKYKHKKMGKLIRFGLTIGVNCSLSEKIISSFFHNCMREVELVYTTASDQEILRLIQYKQLDIGVLLGVQPDSEAFDIISARRGKLYVKVNHESPLARKKQTQIGDIKGLPFITQGEEFGIHQLFWQKCREHGFVPEVINTVSDPQTINHLIRLNAGISYGMGDVNHHCNLPEVVNIPLEGSDMVWRSFVIKRKGACHQEVERYFQTVRSFVKEYLTEEQV